MLKLRCLLYETDRALKTEAHTFLCCRRAVVVLCRTSCPARWLRMPRRCSCVSCWRGPVLLWRLRPARCCCCQHSEDVRWRLTRGWARVTGCCSRQHPEDVRWHLLLVWLRDCRSRQHSEDMSRRRGAGAGCCGATRLPAVDCLVFGRCVPSQSARVHCPSFPAVVDGETGVHCAVTACCASKLGGG